ncbi:MAG: rod shape-determining protein MreC [Tissierellia bacterium]|nr:rod shape-determining protein MreC [Tissierellia bacterium]
MSFFRRNRERMMVTLVAIILIILIGVTSTERMAITKFERILGNVLTPVGKLFTNISENISSFFSNVKNIAKLKEENEMLKKKVSLLEEENRNYLNIIGKTDYLRNELRLLESTKYNLIEAQVTGKEPGNWFDRFTIDKGLKDGVEKGNTVVQGVQIDQNTVIEGIVGRVVDVGDNWAKVVSIVDEDSKIAFKILRTQDGGIISGNIDGKITGYLFDDKADVIKGDKLFTSGLGGAFVKDIYIGEIESVISDDKELMKAIEIKPAIDFKKIYKVFIISD